MVEVVKEQLKSQRAARARSGGEGMQDVGSKEKAEPRLWKAEGRRH
jgi:hypothetical protein